MALPSIRAMKALNRLMRIAATTVVKKPCEHEPGDERRGQPETERRDNEVEEPQRQHRERERQDHNHGLHEGIDSETTAPARNASRRDATSTPPSR